MNSERKEDYQPLDHSRNFDTSMGDITQIANKDSIEVIQKTKLIDGVNDSSVSEIDIFGQDKSEITTPFSLLDMRKQEQPLNQVGIMDESK